MATRYMYRVTDWFARTARALAAAVIVATAVMLLVDPARTQSAGTAEQTSTPSDEPPLATRPEVVFSYTPELRIDGGGEERDLIEEAVRSASLLFTYVEEPLDSVGVLFARARADVERVVRTLNALGYFGPRVSVTVAGAAVDDTAAEDALAADPPQGKIPVTIALDPGRLFTFGRVAVVAPPGASSEAIAALPPTTTGLIEGAPARSADVAAANARIVATLRERGHALAAVVGREAIADHATSKLELTFRVDPGPKTAFGAVAIQGAQNVEPEFLTGLAPFEPGQTFSQTGLDDYRIELERLMIFNSVTIEEAGGLDAQGRLPMTVVVSERPLHVVGVSASWSTLEGLALGSYWVHRNLWGRAERLRLDAQSSRLLMNGVEDYEYAFSAALTKPAFPTRRDDLILTAAVKRERPDAFERDAALVDARIRRRYDKFLSGEVGLGFAQSRETDALGMRDRSTIQIPANLVYDNRDNPLDATRGFRVGGGVQPIINITRGRGIATRFDAGGSIYWRLDEAGETVLASRLGLGASLAGNLADLPVDLRYFAGGGGSVRGYEYQALSPRNAVGQLIGGRSLAEGSLEVRSWIWDDFGAAAFVDAGSASSSNFPDFADVGAGVGVGARYRTPLGPIRLDIAIPLDPPPGDAGFGVYVALGQAF